MHNKLDAKTQVVGLTRVLCDTPALLGDDNGKKIWAQAFRGVVTILMSQTLSSRDDDGDDEAEVQIGYDATYTRLSLASKKPEDPFANVQDPVAAFTQALQGLSSQRPGSVGPIIQESLAADAKLLSGFQSMLQQGGVNIH